MPEHRVVRPEHASLARDRAALEHGERVLPMGDLTRGLVRGSPVPEDIAVRSEHTSLVLRRPAQEQ